MGEVFLNIELRKARLWRYPIVEMLKLLFSTPWAVCVQHALTPEPVVSRNYRRNNFHSMLPTDERDLQRVRSRRRLKTFSSLSLFLSFCFLSDSGMLETDSTVNFSISAVFLVWDFFAMFN